MTPEIIVTIAVIKATIITASSFEERSINELINFIIPLPIIFKRKNAPIPSKIRIINAKNVFHFGCLWANGLGSFGFFIFCFFSRFFISCSPSSSTRVQHHELNLLPFLTV